MALADGGVHARVEDGEAGLAVRLGHVHRDVGVAHDVGGALGRRRGALAMPMLALTVTWWSPIRYGRPKLAGQPLGHGQRPLQVGGVLGEDRELIATKACDEVAVADRVGEPFRHGLQQPVAGGVTQRVVDDLEVVEVDEEHGRDRVSVA